VTELPPEEAAAPRPAWPVAAATSARRHVDLKLVIAILIGLVSVTGAVMTWQSAQLGEFATDKDRQAVAETVIQQQDAANDEIALQDARTRVAAHTAALVTADVLDQQSQRFADAGDAETSRDLADEAEDQRAAAASYLAGTSNLDLTEYVVVDEATGERTFNERAMRLDLRAQSQAQSQVDPTQTVREANRLRDESQRLDGWLVPLILAVVILTLAQISRRLPIRIALTCLAAFVWIGSAAIAFTGS
jgi:hypothetical protein